METDAISPEFKVKWLNETLKFIKDDQSLIYKYPPWPIDRVKYYHALIAQRQNKVGLGFKSLYAALWEAMQIFSLKYTFKVSIIDLKDEKGRLVLEKIPKGPEEQDEADSDEDSKCIHQLTKKVEKLYIENRVIIDKISPSFLKTTLQSLLDFIKDESMGSTVFKDLAPIEAKFIQNIQTIHDHKYLFYKILSPACILILRNITTRLDAYRHTFNLKVEDIKTNAKTAKREVTVIKEPNFAKAPPKKEIKLKENRKKLQVNPPDPPVKALRSPKGVASVKTPDRLETQPTFKKEGAEISADITSVTQTESNPATKTESGKEKEIISSATSTCLQKKGKTVTCTYAQNRVVTDRKKDDVRVVEPPVRSMKSLTRAERNTLMIEAMSKPLESDKGLRMMKLMGWEGGALGLRGDGITEPLIPALHLKPGRGLGAPAAESQEQTKKNPTDLSVRFLEGILEVLHRKVKIVHFGKPLSKKEAKFCTAALADFNRRSKVNLSTDRENKLVEDILDELRREPDMKIDFILTNGAR